MKVSLKDFIDQLFLLGVSDFVNITTKFGESNISLSQAIQLIPFRSRKIGQVITFLDENGEWRLYQFQGERVNQWNNATLWVDLIERIQGISIIDSEDITATVDNLNQTSLTFADKNYNTTDYSGLGRVYLRKNIQSVVNPNTGITYSTNLLTQQMLNKENTIYVLQYDYSLNYQTISIPEGSILVFEGGDINNGTLNCNSTIIVGKFRGNATIAGTYSFQDAQADEEDITQSQSSVLKFKNKGYDEANFSGLGRTYLRKNIVNGVNVLTQDMINNPNTIYHIQYDYNLNGQTITIPSGCVLLFEGGSVSNGNLKGNNTYIEGTLNNVFELISFEGKWNLPQISSDMFINYNGYDLLYSMSYLQNDNILNNIIINGDISVSFPKTNSNALVLSSNTNVQINGTISVVPNDFTHYRVIYANSKTNINISGGTLFGDVEGHIGDAGEFGMGISIVSCSYVSIRNMIIRNFWGDGIYIGRDNYDSPTDIRRSSHVRIDNVSSSYNRRQGISITCAFDVNITNSHFSSTGTIKYTAPGYGIDIEPNNQYDTVSDIQILNCIFDSNSSEGLDKSILIYAPYNNVRSVLISDSLCSGRISITGLKNSRISNTKLADIIVVGVDITDNVLFFDNYISKKEDLKIKDYLVSYGNKWRQSNAGISYFSLTSKYTKVTVPIFKGILNFNIINRAVNSNNFLDKEVVIKMDYNFLVFQKSTVEYKYSYGGRPYTIGELQLANSIKISDGVLEGNSVTFYLENPNDSFGDTLGISIEQLWLAGFNSIDINSIKVESVTSIPDNLNFKENPKNPIVSTVRFVEDYCILPVGLSIYDYQISNYVTYNGEEWVNEDGTLTTKVVII